MIWLIVVSVGFTIIIVVGLSLYIASKPDFRDFDERERTCGAKNSAARIKCRYASVRTRNTFSGRKKICILYDDGRCLDHSSMPKKTKPKT